MELSHLIQKAQTFKEACCRSAKKTGIKGISKTPGRSEMTIWKTNKLT